MSIGFHHMRARARLTKGLEPFPAIGSWKRFLDYLMYGVGIIAPIALVPQILQIYTTRSAAGVSLLTWILIAIFNALWALYGAVHKDRQLFFANAFVVLFDLIIVVGILMY
ncbi:MAG: SemiSWEET family transporter [Candidatus Kaiserbacteria bacterium]|nr:SemiSWEET family transporter [Candidatus Kaiserbacteria bacterium]